MGLALAFPLIEVWPTGWGSLKLKYIYMQNEGVRPGWSAFLPAPILFDYIMGSGMYKAVSWVF